MKKLYTSFLFIFCTLFFQNYYAQMNANYGSVLPLVESGDLWPFESPKGRVRDMIVMNDTLYVAGNFKAFAGEELNVVFKWDGNEIHALNSNFNVEESGTTTSNLTGAHCMGIYQNSIVIAVQEQNEPSQVYRYDGNNWSSIGNSLGNHFVNDLIEWNGNLYAATQGNFPLLMLNTDNEWEPVNVPFTGKSNDLEVFDGKLFVNNVSSQVGKIWFNDGFGFQQLFPEMPLFDANAMMVFEQDLFAVGHFNNGEETGTVSIISSAELDIVFPYYSASTLTYAKVNGESFAIVRNLYIDHFIIDENFLFKGSYKPTILSASELTVAPKEYKGRLYLAGTLLWEDDDNLNNAVSVFEPFNYSVLSNEYQDVSKGVVQGIVRSGGAIATSGESQVLFEHMGLNASPVFESGFTMCAKSGDQTFVSVNTWSPAKGNWFPGPYTENYTPNTYRNYNRVWKVTQAEIDAHIISVGQAGYTIPASIAEWPGNGNFGNGESHMLAPFYDDNQNTWYEPELGDYPLIRGKEAMFWVQHGKSTPSFPDPVQVDLHVMAYLEEGEGLNDLALFFHNVVINRSSITYDSLRVGLFNDFDLGNPTDDLVGCDSLLAVSYVYNAGDLDEPSPSNHYGSEVPAFGCVFLSEAMEANTYWNIGLHPINGTPETVSDFYNYMNGRYRTGAYTIDGAPYWPSGPMMFQDSPCGQGTENEIDLGNLPGDRRLMSAGEVHTLQPNESFCFDFAYYFKPKTGDHIETLCAFLEDIPAIHSFYQDKNYSCAYVNNIEEEEVESRLRVFPNPCGDIVNLDLTSISSSQQIQLRIIDAQGRVVVTELINQPNQLLSIDTSKLSAGAYSIVLNTDKEQLTQLLVKE